MSVDIIEFAESLIILEDGKNIRFEPHQKRILRDITRFDENGKLRYSTIIWGEVKKSGKTTVAAILVIWFAFTGLEAPNEIIIAANDLDQSVGRVYRAAKGMIERNMMLKNACAAIKEKETILKNGTVITAIPNDYQGQAGSNHGLVCFDELWGYTLERSRRLYEELTGVPTRTNSIRFIGSYAGFEGESDLLEGLYKQGLGGKRLYNDLPVYVDGDLYMLWSHVPMMPWQTESYYESQKKSLRRNTYLRLHENRWVSSESGFDMDAWDLCVNPEHRPPLPSKQVRLFIGVDASTKRDRSAAVSVYKDGGIICLGPKRFWEPTPEAPMDFEASLEVYLLSLNDKYTIGGVFFDPYQFHRSAVTLQKKGLPMHEFPQTTGNLTQMGQNLFDLIQYRNIELYPDAELRKEVNFAILKESARGLRIAKEKTSHKIDQVVALAMAAFAATDQKEPLGPPPAPSYGYMVGNLPEDHPELDEQDRWILED